MADDILNNNGDVTIANLRMGTNDLEKDGVKAEAIVKKHGENVSKELVKSLSKGLKSLNTIINKAAKKLLNAANGGYTLSADEYFGIFDKNSFPGLTKISKATNDIRSKNEISATLLKNKTYQAEVSNQWKIDQAESVALLKTELKDLELKNSISKSLMEYKQAENLAHKRIVTDYNIAHIQQLTDQVKREQEINIEKKLAVEKWNSEHIEQLKELNELQKQNRELIAGSNEEQKKFSLGDWFKERAQGISSITNGSFRNLGGGIKSFITLVSGRFLSRYAKQFAAFAGNYIENLNLIENAFGQNSKKVAQWAKDFSFSLGVSTNEVMKFAGSFQSLMETMVGATETGQQMSIVLTELTYDIASLRNMDFSEAYNKMQSTIFGGQLKTSRFLGIDISTGALDELLKDLGMVNVRARDLSEAEKVYLRFIKTVNSLEVSGAFGDLSETLSSVTNRIRILRGSWENLMTVIGNAVSGPINKLMAILIGVVQAVTEMIKVFHELPDATPFNKTAGAIGEIAESIYDVNDNLGLLNIDKFNVLGGAGENDAGAGIKAELEALAGEAAEKYTKIADSFSKVDEEVQNIKNGLLQWIFPLGKIDEEGNFIVDDAKTLNSFLASIRDFGKSIVALFNNNKDAIGNALSKLLPILTGILEKIIQIVTWIIDVTDRIGILDELIVSIVVVGSLAKLITAVGSLKTLLISFMAIGIIAAIVDIADKLGGLGGAILGIISALGGLLMVILAIGAAKDATKWTIGMKLAAMAGASIAAAGVIATATSMAKMSKGDFFANSGVPDHGSLYFAGEGSRPEILYNAGGRTNVIDSEILGEEFYKAQVRANQATGGGYGGVAKLIINGKELADATFKDFDYYSKRTTGRGLTSR